MDEQTISFSKLNAYQHCERKAYVKYQTEYRESTRAMTLGKAVHLLLEGYHIVGKPLKEHNDMNTLYTNVLKDSDIDDLEVISSALLLTMQYERWLHRITKEGDKFVDLVVVAQELLFVVGGVKGVIDLLLKDTNTGKHYIADFKTTKGQVVNIQNSIEGNEQFMIYQYAGKLLGYDVEGVYAIVLKTKRVLTTVILTKAKKLSISKANNVSYETITSYLDENSIPHFKYADYLMWLLNEGASNKVYYISYSVTALQNTYDKYMQRKKRIIEVNDNGLPSCDYNLGWTCATSCFFYKQCVGMVNGYAPNLVKYVTAKGDNTTFSFNKGETNNG